MPFKIDLTNYLIEPKKERKLNRFSCSEIYYLINGYTPIKEYIEGKKRKVEEYWDMTLGKIKHQWIQECLKNDYHVELKKEIKIDEIEIVGMADLLTKDYGIEIKTGKLRDKSTKAHEHQAKLYCTLFEVPKFYIVQPVISNDKAILKEIGIVYRDDKWFANQVSKIKKIYQEILLK
jgi:CRISPR/Cas system-associated exonuclease Cas4 (RecB family)